MSVLKDINIAVDGLKAVECQRISEDYDATLRKLTGFEVADLDNKLSMAGRTITRIRKDLGNIRLERYLNEQISDKKG